MSEHVEIEAKYDVAEGQRLPDLVGIGPITTVAVHPEVELIATYYDTTTYRLSDFGATLRRRTGGDDEGWHLKLPVSGDERLEIRRALGRSSVPPSALSSLVRGIVRAEALAPIATLATRRVVHHLLSNDGAVVAEVAEDAVTGERLDDSASPMVWREIEVELVQGDRAAFEAVTSAMERAGFARAAGPSKVGRVLGRGASARPQVTGKTPAGQVLEATWRKAMRDLLAADLRLRLDRPGAAAEMGSALRRLQAAVVLGRQLAASLDDQEIGAELTWLAGALVPLDAVDTAGPRIRSALAAEPRELVLGPVARRADRELAAARRAAFAASRELLDSARYLTMLDTVAAGPRAGSAADRKARAVIPVIAERTARRVERRLRQLRRAQSDQERRWQLGGARRAVARARVADEMDPGSSTGEGCTSYVLDEVSAVLRELDASQRSQDALRAIGLAAQAAGENAFTPGRLHGVEELRADEALRRLGKLAKALKRSRTP